MRIMVVDPNDMGRRDLVAMLRWYGIAVVSFAHASTALLFLLARLDWFDGVLVNDDEEECSTWLRRRVECVSTAVPVVPYSGRHLEEGAWDDPLLAQVESRMG